MVISHKMIEKEMGYRGSKPLLYNSKVKEQRVDGSYFGPNPQLRCTLMGFERNYQVKILSKQINKVRSYNSLAVNPAYSEVGMNPLFLTGFSDGEACFLVNIYKSSKHKTGWGARATFEIGLDLKDLPILNRIKSYLGVGNVTSRTNGSCVYSVQSIKDLDVLIEHFDKYPLITKKGVDYLLFKKAVNLIKNKEHLTMKGLRKIVSIRASMN